MSDFSINKLDAENFDIYNEKKINMIADCECESTKNIGISSLFKILNNRQSKYVIPEYQREYVWDKKMLINLFKDFKLILNSNSVYYNEHFLGFMIIKQLTSPNQKITNRIIDGQQRLVTLVIFLCVIRDYIIEDQEKIKNSEYSEIAAQINEWLQIDNLEPRIKYDDEFKSPIKEDFKNIIMHEMSNEKSKHNKKTQIIDAYHKLKSLFTKLLTEEQEEHQNVSEVNYLRKLVFTLTQKMFFALISLTADPNSNKFPIENRIFESLNNNGKKLEQYDLVKNYLINLWKYSSDDKRTKEKKKEFSNKFWPFIDTLKKEKNNFFYQFVKTYKSDNSKVREQDYYDAFKNIVEIKLESDFIKTIELLGSFKDKYKYFLIEPKSTQKINKTDDLYVQRFYYKKFNNHVSLPILIKLKEIIEDNNNQYDENILIEMLKRLNSYLMRRICVSGGDGLKDDNNVLLRFYYENLNNNNDISDIIVKFDRFVAKREVTTTKNPDNTLINNSFFEKDFYQNKKTAKWLKNYFDYLVNVKNKTWLNNQYIDIDSYTIEHFIPQNPNSDWKQILSDDDYKAISKIGNLFIFNQSENSKLSNKSFEEKKKLITEKFGFVLKFNTTVLNEKKWGFEEVEKRTELLYKYFIECFPDYCDRYRNQDDKNEETTKIKIEHKDINAPIVDKKMKLPSVKSKNVKNKENDNSISAILANKEFIDNYLINDEIDLRLTFRVRNEETKGKIATMKVLPDGKIKVLKGSAIKKYWDPNAVKKPEVIQLREDEAKLEDIGSDYIWILKEDVVLDNITDVQDFTIGTHRGCPKRLISKQKHKYIEDVYVEWKTKKESL
ncbi:DUF262 domain-containing protein [Mycoplasma sp. Pen4]|uniref:DUF262 domain-containing protein n=1 Tax=Mycoplasma sp. Pen4 TaxID=640330 RepID=UPI001654037B|nr:DUF262 domain-containing protein [Mycoplasma sp. Pen4]QNM93784.1 DUF262 domain-containing protein [Mycoplasma sp. Pen4]